MKTTLYGILAILGAALIAHFAAAYRFNTTVAELREGVIAAVPDATDATPPEVVTALARRAGAEGSTGYVTLFQTAEKRVQKGGDWRPLEAEQKIALSQPAFVWVADQPGWPVPPVRILDAFLDGEGRLQERLFGSLPIADEAGPLLSKSEAMRYLAELPWAPDALLSNPDLTWEVVDDATLTVSLALPEDRATVTLRLNEEGDITEISAEEHPTTNVNGATVLLPWRGSFSDYAEIGGRRIPTRAEMGYVYEDGFEAYWRGQITEYEVHLP